MKIFSNVLNTEHLYLILTQIPLPSLDQDLSLLDKPKLLLVSISQTVKCCYTGGKHNEHTMQWNRKSWKNKVADNIVE